MASKEPSLLKDLITANHILHHHHIVDAYGHISLRNPNNPHTFFLSHSIAPALVSSPSDIVEYNIEDASPVKKDVSAGYKERCIHSEILKKYPGINSVVHSHSDAVLPYSISGVEMKPCIHMAGFLGPHVPLFDATPHYTRTDRPDLLISTQPLGAALAATFSKPDSYLANIASTLLSTATGPAIEPDHTVVLMRGHGFTALGADVREAVYRAVFTHVNAGVQTTAIALRDARMAAVERGRGEAERAKGPVRDEGVRGLAEAEMAGCAEMNQETAGRPWGLWVREVEATPLYVNQA